MAYSSFERSINARKQLRDRYGRWVDMGGSVKFRHAGKDRSGIVDHFEGEYAVIDSENPDTKKTERLKKHRSEFEGVTSKAKIKTSEELKGGKAAPGVTNKAVKKALLENGETGVADDASDDQLRESLATAGFDDDDIEDIVSAETYEDAKDAFDTSVSGAEAYDKYASAIWADNPSDAESNHIDAFDNAKADLLARFKKSTATGISQDAHGNFTVPNEDAETVALADIQPGDKILSRGKNKSPQMTEGQSGIKTNGDVLTLVDKWTDDSGWINARFSDESGNEIADAFKPAVNDDYTPSYVKASTIFDEDSLGNAEPVVDETADTPGDDEMLDAANWTKDTSLGGQKGSNPGGFYRDQDGDAFYVKVAKSDLHAKNEALAAKFYTRAGIRNATQELVKLGTGKLGTASPLVPGAKSDLQSRIQNNDKEYLDDLREGFAVDAWLANWDVAGLAYDNVVTDENGDPVRVDPGGALLFRAMGGEKGSLFGESVGEWNSMRDPSRQAGEIFADMTDAQLKASARKVAAFSDEEINEIVDSVQLNDIEKEQLSSTLKARRDDIIKRAGLDESATEQPVEEAPEATEVAEAPLPTDTHPFVALSDSGASGDGYHASGPWGKYGAAGIMVRAKNENGEDAFLLVQRGPGVSSNQGMWQLPGGALNSKENPAQGAARETSEELGATPEYLAGLRHTGDHVFDNGEGWQYTSMAAEATSTFEPAVDGTETSAAKWATASELADMKASGELAPAFAKSVDDIVKMFATPEQDETKKAAPADIDSVLPEPEGAEPTQTPATSEQTGESDGRYAVSDVDEVARRIVEGTDATDDQGFRAYILPGDDGLIVTHDSNDGEVVLISGGETGNEVEGWLPDDYDDSESKLARLLKNSIASSGLTVPPSAPAQQQEEETTPEPEASTPPAIGDPVLYEADLDELPVGSEISGKHGNKYVKKEDNTWKGKGIFGNKATPDYIFAVDEEYKVSELPGVDEEVDPSTLMEGTGVSKTSEYNALPVGTRVSSAQKWKSSAEYVKQEDGTWAQVGPYSDEPISEGTTTSQEMAGAGMPIRNVRSLPSPAAPPASEYTGNISAGSTIATLDDLNALPADTVATFDGDDYTKQSDGRWAKDSVAWNQETPNKSEHAAALLKKVEASGNRIVAKIVPVIQDEETATPETPVAKPTSDSAYRAPWLDSLPVGTFLVDGTNTVHLKAQDGRWYSEAAPAEGWDSEQLDAHAAGTTLEPVGNTAPEAPESAPEAVDVPEAPVAPTPESEASAHPLDAFPEVVRNNPTALEGEKYPPTQQQQDVHDAVLGGLDVKVQAKAGAGKTSTLEALSRRIAEADATKRVIYIVFNKSAQTEAEKRMPGNTESRTGHSLAYAKTPTWMRDRNANKQNAMNKPSEVADHFDVSGVPGELSRREVVQHARRAVEKFAQSADDDIQVTHVEDDEVSDEAREVIVALAKKMWADINDQNGVLPVEHDHYRKRWALTRPDLSDGTGGNKAAQILFIDEAQDTPPVLAKVVADQNMQKVIVGDADQAINGFAGAVDYLSQAEADIELPLNKSWRFGANVADIGNRFLQLLNSPQRVVGGAPDPGIIGPVDLPDAILTRTNAGMLFEILEQQALGRSVGVPVGTKADLKKLARSIAYLKGEDSKPESLHDDVLEYEDWNDIEMKALKDDAKAKKIVNLFDNEEGNPVTFYYAAIDSLKEGGAVYPGVEVTKDENGITLGGKTYGINVEVTAKRLGVSFKEAQKIKKEGLSKLGFYFDFDKKEWKASGKTPEKREQQYQALLDLLGVDDSDADVTISTAHKSKGLEWDNVKISDDFRTPKEDKLTGEMIMPDDDEHRLAYVAVTRAKKALDPGSLDYVFNYTEANGGLPGKQEKPLPEVGEDTTLQDLITALQSAHDIFQDEVEDREHAGDQDDDDSEPEISETLDTEEILDAELTEETLEDDANPEDEATTPAEAETEEVIEDVVPTEAPAYAEVAEEADEPQVIDTVNGLNALALDSEVAFGGMNARRTFRKTAPEVWTATWMPEDSPYREVSSDDIMKAAALSGSSVELTKNGSTLPATESNVPEPLTPELQSLADDLEGRDIGTEAVDSDDVLWVKTASDTWADDNWNSISSEELAEQSNGNITFPNDDISSPINTIDTLVDSVPGQTILDENGAAYTKQNDGAWVDSDGYVYNNTELFNAVSGNFTMGDIDNDGVEFQKNQEILDRLPAGSTVDYYNQFYTKREDGMWTDDAGFEYTSGAVLVNVDFTDADIMVGNQQPESPIEDVEGPAPTPEVDEPTIEAVVDETQTMDHAPISNPSVGPITGIGHDDDGIPFVLDKSGTPMRVGDRVYNKQGKIGQITHIKKGGKQVTVRTPEGEIKHWNNHLVTKTDDKMPKVGEKKYAVHSDAAGNKYVLNGEDKRIYVGDKVHTEGKTAMSGTVVGFSPDGTSVRIQDENGVVKPRKNNKVILDESNTDIPDEESGTTPNTYPMGSKEVFDEMSAGHKLTNEDFDASGHYMEKNEDGSWSIRRREDDVAVASMPSDSLSWQEWRDYEESDESATDEEEESDESKLDDEKDEAEKAADEAKDNLNGPDNGPDGIPDGGGLPFIPNGNEEDNNVPEADTPSDSGTPTSTPSEPQSYEDIQNQTPEEKAAGWANPTLADWEKELLYGPKEEVTETAPGTTNEPSSSTDSDSWTPGAPPEDENLGTPLTLGEMPSLDEMINAPVGSILVPEYEPAPYDNWLVKLPDGNWQDHLSKGSSLTPAKWASQDIEGGGWAAHAWDQPGILLNDENDYKSAPIGTVVKDNTGQLSKSVFEKTGDDTWTATNTDDGSWGGEFSNASISPIVGQAVTIEPSQKTAPAIEAPSDAPESTDMEWFPGKPLSTVDDFENAPIGTGIHSELENLYYKKTPKGAWRQTDPSGKEIGNFEYPSDVIFGNMWAFKVDKPATADSVQAPTKVGSYNELLNMPTGSVISFSEDPNLVYRKTADGKWQTFDVTHQKASESSWESEDFKSSANANGMWQQPSSIIGNVADPAPGEEFSSYELSMMPTGTLLTDTEKLEDATKILKKVSGGQWNEFTPEGTLLSSHINYDAALGYMPNGKAFQHAKETPDLSALPDGTVINVNLGPGVNPSYYKKGPNAWVALKSDGSMGVFEYDDNAFGNVLTDPTVFSKPSYSVGDDIAKTPNPTYTYEKLPEGSEIKVETPGGVNAEYTKNSTGLWQHENQYGVEQYSSENMGSEHFWPAGTSITLQKVGAGATAPSTPVSDPTAPSVLDHTGNPIQVGDTVSHYKKPLSGMVTKIDVANGQVFFKEGGKGPVKSFKAKFVNKDLNAPKVALGKTAKAKNVEPAPVDPSSPWFEKEPPVKPTPPQPLIDPFLTDEWIEKADAGYQALPANAGKNKSLKDSSYWPVIDKVIKSGETAIPAHVINTGGKYGDDAAGDIFDWMQRRNYITPEDAEQARALIDAQKAVVQQYNGEYNAKKKQYQEDYEAWSAANGHVVTGFDGSLFTLKGMGGQVKAVKSVTDNQAYQYGDQFFTDMTSAPKHIQDGLRTWTTACCGSYNVDYSSLAAKMRTTKEAGLDPSYDWNNKEITKAINSIDEAMEMSQFPEDIVVVRSAETRNFVLDDGTELKNSYDLDNLVGQTITDYGYMATSLGENPAMSSGKNIRLVMRVPEGYNGVWLSSKNGSLGLGNEREVLLPRGTKLYIHRIGDYKGHMRTVYAEIVPNNWYPPAEIPGVPTDLETEIPVFGV
jgi:ADP-ribose pyrophosphatase YjhB (NUDIX family)